MEKNESGVLKSARLAGTELRLRQGWNGGTIKGIVGADGTVRHASSFSPLYESGDAVSDSWKPEDCYGEW